jgi:hypothetical protein
LNDYLNACNVDGVHFSPSGHRLISHYLIQIMSKLFQENMTRSVDQLLSITAGGNGDSNPNETP